MKRKTRNAVVCTAILAGVCLLAIVPWLDMSWPTLIVYVVAVLFAITCAAGSLIDDIRENNRER